MKKMSRISLHNLSQAELAKREEKFLRGGDGTFNGGTIGPVCVTPCPCLYEGPKENDQDAYYGGSAKKDEKSFDSNLAKVE